MLVAVAIGFVSDARSKSVSAVIGVRSGRRERDPYARSKRISSCRPTTTTHPGILPAAIVLPAMAVGTHLMAMLARMTRSSLVEVLGEDYVRTARAKGLPERSVLFRHALRNALLPVITVAGLQFGSLLSGAIIIENVFARPGLGSTLLEAISERNYPVVQGTVLVISVIYVVVNVLVDLAYGLADPRIRVG